MESVVKLVVFFRLRGFMSALLPWRFEKYAIQPVHKKVQELGAKPDARQRDKYPVNEKTHPDR